MSVSTKTVMNVLSSYPFLSTAMICRKINGISQVKFCRFCVDYANSRKRKKWPHRIKPPCPIRMIKVVSVLKQLEKDGKIQSKWKKLPDSYNNRGYDLYHIYYLPRNDPDKHQTKLLPEGG